jgi:hypothetical protein
MSGSASGAQPTTLPLTPIITESGNDDGGRFAITMLVASGPDRDSGGGDPALHFSLRIVNTRSDEAVLVNPYEGLTVEVADEHGQPVALPAPPRAAKTGRWEQALETRQRYVRLESLAVDGTSLDPEHGRAERFSLGEDSALQMDLAVERVRSSPGSPDARPVGAGAYLIGVLLPLGWDDQDGRHNVIFRSDGAARVISF